MDLSNWLFGNNQSNTDQPNNGGGTQPPFNSAFQGDSTRFPNGNTYHGYDSNQPPNCAYYGEGTSQPSKYLLYEEGTAQPYIFTSLLNEGMQNISLQGLGDPNNVSRMRSLYATSQPDGTMLSSMNWPGMCNDDDLNEADEVHMNDSGEEENKEGEEENEEAEEENEENDEEEDKLITYNNGFQNAILRGVNNIKKRKSLLYNNFMAEHFTTHRKKPIPYHTYPTPGYVWVHNVLTCQNEDRATDVFGMTAEVFMMLHDELIASYGWEEPKKADGIRLREALGMLLCLLRGWKNHAILERFNRPKSSLSNQLTKILPCFVRFASDWVRPEPEDQHGRHPYLETRTMYRHFEGCIGAIDGTHVPTKPAPSEFGNFWGRKGGATMNVMVACNFNLRFTFAVSGFEGCMHDYNIFKRVTNDPSYRFPKPETGKYYLVDCGYPNKLGYLAPYKGYTYHLEDFKRRRVSLNHAEERFNRAHSSLRSCVERAFGVWKSRFWSMKNGTTYDLDTHKKLVIISMAIHNYIRRYCPTDKLFHDYDWHKDNYDRSDIRFNDALRSAYQDQAPQPQDHDSDRYMNTLRDIIRDNINWQAGR